MVVVVVVVVVVGVGGLDVFFITEIRTLATQRPPKELDGWSTLKFFIFLHVLLVRVYCKLAVSRERQSVIKRCNYLRTAKIEIHSYNFHRFSSALYWMIMVAE